MGVVRSFVSSLRVVFSGGDVFVCCIFDDLVYNVAGFVGSLLRCEIVGVVKEVLECLQVFPCCSFHVLTECFLDGIKFEFVCAVGCARCFIGNFLI